VAIGWGEVRAAIGLRAAASVPDQVGSRAAVAVVLREGERGLEVLFMRRAEYPDDPWSGQMSFPGGRAEQGDADLLATAVRETLEETGIDLARDAELLGPLDEVRAMARLRPMDLTIAPFVFRLRRAVEQRPSAEVAGLHWLALDDLTRPELRSTMEYPHLEARLTFPCLRVQDLVIWGLTYRMFLGLLERMGLPAAAGEGGLGAEAQSGVSPQGPRAGIHSRREPPE
jgi:8-oxo-dGTP pyrophosphatase MutT (NUDIX family)